jgi:iron complex transport system substrate-binding protein
MYSPELNRYLEIPDKVSKIASLTPSVTETIVEMGLTKLLGGVSSWCKVLALAKNYGDRILNLPTVGSYDSINESAARNFDLVLFSGGYQRILADKLQKLNTSFYVVTLPKSVWGIAEMILQVGTALGEVNSALILTNKFTEELYKVMKSIEKVQIYVELNLGEEVLPGLFSHIVTGLELLGGNVVNKRLIEPYTLPGRSRELKHKLAKKAEIILYEDHTLFPQTENLKEKLSSRYGISKDKIIILPTLTLTDYGPLFTNSLKYVATRINELI